MHVHVCVHVSLCFINFSDFVGSFRTVFDSLRVIDPHLMHPSASHDQLVPVMVNKLLTKLGVKELLPQDIICHHIIPRLTEKETKASIYHTHTMPYN